jgi:PhzF family phenazine biosynthesis protein
MSPPPDYPPRVWLYASFASTLGGGNPAGVVVSLRPIETEIAQSIASALSVPTTGFVRLDDTVGKGSASVRFFTPEREIDACGHVTVAIATALVELGAWEWGRDVAVHAPGCEFPLRLRAGKVEMDQHRQVLEEAATDWGQVETALGPVRARAELPLAIAGTGLRHLIVPLADGAALSDLALDAGRIARLAQCAAVDTICVWAPGPRPAHYRVRDLCAGIGAIEEAASGTTSGALALYLEQQRQLDGRALVIEQGVEMGRPSRIEVVVTPPDQVTVRGEAQKILEGTLVLPTAGCA